MIWIWFWTAVVMAVASIGTMIAVVVEGYGAGWLTPGERNTLRISVLTFFCAPFGIFVIPVALIAAIAFGIFKLGKGVHYYGFVKPAEDRR